MADAGASNTLVIGAPLPSLDLSRAWLVDPATGREGPGEIVVRDGLNVSRFLLST